MALIAPQIALPACCSIAPADTTVSKPLRTCVTAAGEVVGRIRACSTDSATQTLQFIRTSGSVDYIIGESQVLLGAGTNGTTPYKDLLADINQGNPVTLANGEVLKVRSKTTVTAATKIDVTAEAVALG